MYLLAFIDIIFKKINLNITTFRKGDYRLNMSKNDDYITRKTRRKKRGLKLRYKILLPFLIIALAVGGFVWYLDAKANNAVLGAHDGLDRDKSDLRDDYVNPKDDNVSILLMGIDSSDKRGADEIARTDALLVATLNVKDKSVKVLSIPRDAYVYIPHIGREDKINHAHAFGKGPLATVETVEGLLGIPIDYYLRMNFEAFIGVVDALDGIDIDVPFEFKEQDSHDVARAIHLYPGMQNLDGEEALALARTRKIDSDFERGKRQQEVIKAIVDRSLSVSSILKYDDVIKAIGDNMKTNMQYNEMKSFFGYLTHGKDIDIETLNVGGYDDRINNIYYYQLDPESLAETINTMQHHLEIEITDPSYNPDARDNPDETNETNE